MREMKSALYGKSYRMHNVYVGIGGRDVPPSTIEKIINTTNDESPEVIWIDLE